MTTSRLQLLTFSMLIIILSACSDGGDLEIDDRLVPYYERFTSEAALRGVTFDPQDAQIEGYIDQLDNLVGGDILGFCQQPRPRFPLSSIYIDESFWAGATDLQREYVVFHELGHCFLNRDHPQPDPVDSLGNCSSIMAAGDANCNGLESYNEDRRPLLLDELFAN